MVPVDFEHLTERMRQLDRATGAEFEELRRGGGRRRRGSSRSHCLVACSMAVYSIAIGPCKGVKAHIAFGTGKTAYSIPVHHIMIVCGLWQRSGAKFLLVQVAAAVAMPQASQSCWLPR
jgi:hypothetical protein